MDILSLLLEHVGLAAGSGAGGFAGAFFQFKTRLKDVEDTLKTLRGTINDEFPKIVSCMGQTLAATAAQREAWQLEFRAFQESVHKDLRHKDEIDEAEERGRKARPDPLEDLYSRMEKLEREIEKFRRRDAGYVRDSRFLAFAKEQEQSWREMREALGEIRGILDTWTT